MATPRFEGHLNGLAADIHQTAVDKGWWEKERNFGEVLALMHSELSEALEAWREGNDPGKVYLDMGYAEVEYALVPKDDRSGKKPEGVAVELIDCVIRILDWLYDSQVDIDLVMDLKMEYNEGRPYRHGGKLA